MAVSTSRPRFATADAAFAGLGLAVVGLVGLVTGFTGFEGIVFVAAVGVAALFLVHPFVGLCVLVATFPVQNVFPVAEGVTGTKIAGLLVFAAWGIHKVLRRESFKPVILSSFFLLGGIFLTLALASGFWAQVPRVAVRGFVQLFQLFGLSIIVIDLTRSWKRADLLARALVVGGTLAAVLTIEQYFVGHAIRAGEAIAGGVNSTSAMLVTLLPFGFYLFRTQETKRWRMCGLAFVGLAMLAIIVTVSRAAMLVLPPLLLALAWETFRGGRGRRWLVGVVGVGAVVAIVYVPWASVLERAKTIVPYIEQTISSKDVGNFGTTIVSGRGFHYRVGLAIARDYPVLGAGFRNYGYLFIEEYQYSVPGSDNVYGEHRPGGGTRSPHSSYVGILADLGVVGLTLWVLLCAVGVRAALRAWRLTRHDSRSVAHVFVQSVAFCLFLQIFAYSWVLVTDRDTIFWALLALSIVVLRLAEGQMRPAARTTRI